MKKKNHFIYLIIFVILGSTGCSGNEDSKNFISDNIANAVAQNKLQVHQINTRSELQMPRTIKKDGSISYIRSLSDWTIGFYPGSMWYMYRLTGNKKWETIAEQYTERLDSVKYLTSHHDVGFMINCSYGNGYEVTKSASYKEVIIQAAKSLSTRFRPKAGIIQSWNTRPGGWQATRGWECPVIIDNMMNLELLFKATQLSGDSSFYKIAVSHADVTLANHFRSDNSCYHVVDYDTITGAVRSKETAQGYSNESAWARGQAWAIYGYVICYRYTKDARYLAQAEKIYSYLFNSPTMPKDLVPYWDFNAPNIPNEPRDASAAAIIASALYELNTCTEKKCYLETADKIMCSLGSPQYRAKVGTNGNFILMHSVGSIPHKVEIDVPLNYADYYFLEALYRKQQLECIQ